MARHHYGTLVALQQSSARSVPGAPWAYQFEMRVRFAAGPGETKPQTREIENMSEKIEAQATPKNRSWIYLVAAFIVLAAIGVLTS
jgi:hypothetical protein